VTRAGATSRATAVAAATCMLLAACGTAPSAADPPDDYYGVVIETTPTSADYGRMERAGVDVLRMQLLWPGIQPAADSGYKWDATDTIVRRAAEHGITVLPILFGTPSWESGGCDTRICTVQLPVGSASQRQGWTDFVSAAAQRYGPGGSFWTENPGTTPNYITRWQLWNEQNSLHVDATPTAYTKLVQLAATALRTQNPTAEIMLGGMFGTPNATTSPKHTAWGFLDGLYKQGLKPDFDFVALHPYSPGIAGIRYQIKRLRKVMKRHNDSNTPLVVSEIGWGSDKAHNNHDFVETPQGQAKMLTKSFQMFLDHRRSWKIGGVDWFAWRDPPKGSGLCGFCYSAGLYTRDGTAKPALHAYKGFAG
jgi:hypothetical protein